MKWWPFLAVAAAFSAADAFAQDGSPVPVGRAPAGPAAFRMPAELPASVRYPVTPEAGEWLVCVQTFKGAQSRLLAEEMVEVLMADYKLSAYIYDRGYKQRVEESQRIQQVRDRYWDSIEAMQKQGIEPVGPLRYRTMRIADEYAVLVGKPRRPLKKMEDARDFLDDLRKQKPPPDRFSTKVVFGNDDAGGKVKQTGSGYLNPFATAMVVHNPTIEIKKEVADPEKADDFLKQLNSNENMSVLKCSKPWTLVVKMFQGAAVYHDPKGPSLLSRLGLSKEPETLNASAINARETAKFLRNTKPSFEAYVMHQRAYSIVTVGQYDSPNDPELLANQRSLAGLKLEDKASGMVLVTLNAQPLPMKIPR